jgi:hypothetical protein
MREHFLTERPARREFGPLPQLRRLALSDTNIRRKRHESTMSIVMKL